MRGRERDYYAYKIHICIIDLPLIRGLWRVLYEQDSQIYEQYEQYTRHLDLVRLLYSRTKVVVTLVLVLTRTRTRTRTVLVLVLVLASTHSYSYSYSYYEYELKIFPAFRRALEQSHAESQICFINISAARSEILLLVNRCRLLQKKTIGGA